MTTISMPTPSRLTPHVRGVSGRFILEGRPCSGVVWRWKISVFLS
ncbi:unnamed protein product [Linum tenue]|uniref:Uncharacterized protein n=1 Tax=Linum tenue TaxID=586396 RepID=A0AAV0IBM4_9ROSI|nr:unnamed protein product [Linum tenue]